MTGTGCHPPVFQPGFKMLSLKLPRLLNMEQVPQVCALAPVVEVQAETGAWPCSLVTAVSSATLLCVDPPSARSPSRIPLGNSSFLFPSPAPNLKTEVILKVVLSCSPCL